MFVLYFLPASLCQVNTCEALKLLALLLVAGCMDGEILTCQELGGGLAGWLVDGS